MKLPARLALVASTGILLLAGLAVGTGFASTVRDSDPDSVQSLNRLGLQNRQMGHSILSDLGCYEICHAVFFYIMYATFLHNSIWLGKHILKMCFLS